MYKEISEKSAILNYLNGNKSVSVIITKSNGIRRIYTLEEIFKNCRYLIDETEELVNIEKESEDEINIDDLGNSSNCIDSSNISEDDNFENKNEFNNIERKEDKTIEESLDSIDELKTSEEIIENNNIKTIDGIEIEHTLRNDVKISTEEYTDELDSNGSVPKKRKKRIQIDLGKLFALKRAGWKPDKIADELNCGISTVYKYYNNKILEENTMKVQNSSI